MTLAFAVGDSPLTELEFRYELGEVEEGEHREQGKVLMMEDISSIREARKDEQFESSEFWWSRTFGEEQQGVISR